MLSSKLIAMMIAGSGSLVGSGFGAHYYVFNRVSPTDTKSQKLEEGSDSELPKMTSGHRTDETVSRTLGINPTSNGTVQLDILQVDASSTNLAASTLEEQAEEAEEESEELEIKSSGHFYLVRVKDDFGLEESYVCKLTTDKSEGVEEPIFESDFSSLLPESRFKYYLEDFNSWVSINPDEEDVLSKALKSKRNELTSCFGTEVFEKLQEIAKILPSKN